MISAVRWSMGFAGLSSARASSHAKSRSWAHATTVVTNALFEKKVARTGLVTTHGFRDVLELRRSWRSDLYDLFKDPPDVLVPRRSRERKPGRRRREVRFRFRSSAEVRLVGPMLSLSEAAQLMEATFDIFARDPAVGRPEGVAPGNDARARQCPELGALASRILGAVYGGRRRGAIALS